MAKQVIFTGTAANDGTGSNLRSGGIIINNNFNEIYSAIGDGTNLKGYITIEDTSSTQNQVNIGEKLQFIGANGITTSVGNNEIQIAIDGTVLTETSTDTLLNKSINLNVNTITGTTADFNTALSDDDFATIAGTETFTNKTLTSPIINSPTGDVVTLTGAQTITDKTLTSPIINTPTGDVATKDGTQTLTNKTIDTGSNSITGSLFTIADDTSTTSSIVQGDTLKISGGTGISTTTTGDTISIAASGITNTEIDANAGILNTQLANNSVTIGYTAVELGTSSTTVNGLSITGSAYITINGQGSAIRFNYPNFASFPAAATYSGSPALDEALLKPYIATASGWVNLLTENDGVDRHSNVNITGITNGQGMVWNASTTRFEPGSVGGSGAFTAGSALDQLNERISDVQYLSYRSSHNTIIETLPVTVATKTTAHYYYGTGHPSGFFIDGDESPLLQLVPGKWKFDQSDSTNVGHQMKIYRDSNKQIEYTDKVTVNGTAGNAGAYLEIEITEDTPSLLYYLCEPHGGMGHAIEVQGGRSHIITNKSLVADGSTTGFTILAGRIVDDILVFVNGICLVPTDDYTISGTTLTFITAPNSGAEIVIRYLG